MKLIEQVQRGPTLRPPRVTLYGEHGIGKSTLGSETDCPIFVQTEDGLDAIGCDKFPLARSISEVLRALDELYHEKHDYRTVAIDSADWLERLIFDAVCKECGVTSIERADGGYGRGFVHAVTLWREILARLDRLRLERNMVVMLIAHARIERFEDPDTPAYDRYVPRLNKHAAALLCEWCDAVLFATRRLRVQTEDAGFSRRRTIAHAVGRDGGDRVLRCVGGPSCVAKNRYGIVDELPLSWAAFLSAMTLSVKEK